MTNVQEYKGGNITKMNNPLNKFKNTPVGEIQGSQIDIFKPKSDKEYYNLRNSTIVALYNTKLTASDLSRMQVKHIDNSFMMVLIKRGKRVLRVAVSPQITKNLKLLTYCKLEDDYLFTPLDDPQRPLTRTMINKIVAKHEEIEVVPCVSDMDQDIYDYAYSNYKYKILKNGEPTGLEVNNLYNANIIINTLNKDLRGEN